MMEKIALASFSVIVTLFLMAVAGLSQDKDVVSFGAGACKADIDRFCKGVRPGGGRIWSCLRSNEADLSRPCRDEMARAREKGKEFLQACRQDVRKFCKGAPRGEGRIISCLKSHEAELAEPCRAFFKKD